MIVAAALSAVEIELVGFHPETTDLNGRLRANGFTSISVRYVADNGNDTDGIPRVAPARTHVVGVGSLDAAFDEGRKLQAFAVWASSPEEIRALALEIGAKNEAWRCYAAKPSHLPALTAPDSDGRWFVCYAEDAADVPEGIDLADRRRTSSDAARV